MTKKEIAAPDNLDNIIERVARDPATAVDNLERLLALKERAMADHRRTAYYDAMAQLQGELPMITQRGEIRHGGKLISRYARFEDINEAIRPVLAKHRFSAAFKTSFPNNMLEVTCIISHGDGHSEETTMQLPFDVSGSKNSVQAIGSSVSYGKRYALCSFLNISTGGEDDDAVGTVPLVSDEQIAQLKALIDATQSDLDSFLRYAKVSDLSEVPAKSFNTLKAMLEAKKGKSK